MSSSTSSPFSNVRPDATFVAQTQQFVKPPVPTAAQVTAASVKTKTSQIAALQKEIQNLQSLSSIYYQAQYQMSVDQKFINNLRAGIPKGTPPTASQTRDISDALAAYQTAAAAFTKQQGIIQTKQNQITALKNDITKLTTKPVKSKTTSKGGPPPGNTAGDSGTLPYIYNAPMVKSAYLSPFGPQGSSVTDSKLVANPGTFTDARNAWQGVTPSKGVLQMSKMFAQKAPAPTSSAGKAANIIDPNNYGFKFLYNPTNVSMAWGIVDSFSPEYVASGQSQMTAMAIGLMKSTISFSLLLNRIVDMNFFSNDENNIYSAVGMYPGKEPTPDELYDIYKRGTMYDLEYLFKAMGGHYATYKSGLNGTTADRGWLQPIPLELHLGDGLRYLVRVSSLDVTHIQFNERMVPVLTTVNISCTRYYDSPEFLDSTVYSPESVG